MEILSPAGTLQHIKVAIENNVNAVYGGIRKWNARGRTTNFSIKEYNNIVSHLHKHNIKFFLTLNILMFDNEIKSVLSFLKSSSIEKPDAFIVADLGLILELRKNFPDIPVHLSTQFGTHSLEDVNLAIELGAERVVLARELTFNEIKRIRKFTDIELECFVSGSQCVSFSGLCYFSSLLNSGSGNRGTCLINCRDLYKVKDKFGELLYTPDLNCIDLLDEMKDIDSFKLEGRRRNPVEIDQVIKIIQRKAPNKISQAGFIYGAALKDNHLYSEINSRHEVICHTSQLKKCDKNDICAHCKNGIPIKFVLSELDRSNSFYLGSQYTKKYDLNKNNISFVFKLKDSKITQIDYINTQGKVKIFLSKKKYQYIQLTIENFIYQIEKNEKINIFKISYVKSPLTKLHFQIDKELLKSVIEYVQKDNQSNIGIFESNKQLKNVFLETDQISILERYLDDPFVLPIFNIASVHHLTLLKSIKKLNNHKIYYKLPILNFESLDLTSFYNFLEGEKILFTRFSQIFSTKHIEYKEKISDFTIAPWNRRTLLFLKELGITTFTASPEMSYQQTLSVLGNENIQFIFAGHIPLIYTRHCFKHLFECKRCEEGSNHKIIKSYDKILNYNVLCYPDYRILLSEYPILNKYPIQTENTSFRYIATGVEQKNIERNIQLMKQKNYYDLLKNEDYWTNSYQCNIYNKRR